MDAEYQPSQTSRTRKSFKKKIQILKEKTIVENHKKWSWGEHKKYMRFLAKNKLKFLDSDKTKRHRIFNKMAIYLNTRTARQCRTHHQKMLFKHKKIE